MQIFIIKKSLEDFGAHKNSLFKNSYIYKPYMLLQEFYSDIYMSSEMLLQELLFHVSVNLYQEYRFFYNFIRVIFKLQVLSSYLVASLVQISI